jgi:hypothetical protein
MGEAWRELRRLLKAGRARDARYQRAAVDLRQIFKLIIWHTFQLLRAGAQRKAESK